MQSESSKAAAGKSKGDIEGSSITDTERIKLDMKNQLPDSKLVLVWSEVSDKNFGAWRYEEFKGRMAQKDLSILTKGMVKSGMAHVVGFPLAVQCYELILECAWHDDLGM